MSTPAQPVELTVVDTNADGKADRFETVSDAWAWGGEHEFSFGSGFDRDGAIAFQFEALLLRYNANQRWTYFSDMRSDEVLVFKTHDTEPSVSHCVPHGAFDDPGCPESAPPRASIEMRGIAYWFE